MELSVHLELLLQQLQQPRDLSPLELLRLHPPPPEPSEEEAPEHEEED